MSIVNSEIHEGVMLQEEFVSIPVSVFEELIRAETERDILENIITGDKKYAVDDVLKAIQTARAKHHRGTLRVEIGVCPCSCEENASDEKDAADTNAAASDTEVTDETETCE